MTRIALLFAAATTIACAPEVALDGASASAKGIGDRAAQRSGVRGGGRFYAADALRMPGADGGAEGGGVEPDPRPDVAAQQCADAPDKWMDCPAIDPADLDEVPGLVELDRACGDWMATRPSDYTAEMERTKDVGGEVDEAAAKATVCGGWVAEAEDLDSGDPIEPGAFPTVEQVFAEVAQALIEADGPVEVHYDPDFAYPVAMTARIPTDGGYTDMEMIYEIEPVKPIEE